MDDQPRQLDDTPDPECQFEVGVSFEYRKRCLQLQEELTERKEEALRLYRPLPLQELFHRSRASERILRGGNRSGKTLAWAVEIARAATGADPHKKYPTDRPLMIWTIGFNENHLGRVIHLNLFRHGAFNLIRDLNTDEVRAWNPYDESDLSRESERVPAPPLIPFRMVVSESWVNKGERIFSVIRLHDENHPMGGTEIWGFSSMSQMPPMGNKVDVIGIDEDIKYSRHIAELQARLSDTRGKLIWSAFPYNNNDALVDMSARATVQRDLWEREKKPPNVEEVVLAFRDNPFIPEEEKQKRYEGWDDDEINARDLGQFGVDNILVYPTFNKGIHGLPRTAWGEETIVAKHPIEAVLLNNQLPLDWCRYMSVDPGHTLCAVLFAAVPPPTFGDFCVIEDELYLKNCDAEKFADRVAEKVEGRYYEAFIIDDPGSRQTNAATGKTIREQYGEELRKRRVASRITGHGFIPGSMEIIARCATVRRWLRVRTDLTTKFRYVAGNCPNMVNEFGKYKKERDSKGRIGEKPESRNFSHAMNALEYLAQYDPKYHKPEPPRVQRSPVLTLLDSWRDSNKKQAGADYINLGPPIDVGAYASRY